MKQESEILKQNYSENDIYILIITHDRPDFLVSRTFPSIKAQTYLLFSIVVVDDSESKENRIENENLLKNAAFKSSVYLVNQRTPGAAGAWNTGINWIVEQNENAWIAILDDDDEWDARHLEKCIEVSDKKDAIISGITIRKNGVIIAQNHPNQLTIHDFFEGNPGWQGSNTFIRAKYLKKVNGFDETLLSTHDRDLAIRCLADSEFQYAKTDECTVYYNLEFDRPSLTVSNGQGKTTGLLQFYHKHVQNMNESDKMKFKERAKDLFHADPQLFDLLENTTEFMGFKHSKWISKKNISKYLFWGLFYFGKRQWALLRMHRWVTKILKPQFKPTSNQIEIDITYACNLKCENCNRSCRQAPENLEISLDKIQEFVSDSIKSQIEWKRIRILGGEPTLHRELENILYTIIEYKKKYPKTRLELVSNGYGKQVQRNLLKVPPFFHIENSQKQSPSQPCFSPFNLAPRDSNRYKNADFRNGCSDLTECGIGLTSMGYYPCAIAGGIDRIARWKIGLQKLPLNSGSLVSILEKVCPYCGQFRSRIFIPYNFRKKIYGEKMSKSWKELYKNWPNQQR